MHVLAKIEGMPTYCADLQQIGHSLNGFYSIKRTNTLKSVYCNFIKLPGDQGIPSSYLIFTQICLDCAI